MVSDIVNKMVIYKVLGLHCLGLAMMVLVTAMAMIVV